MKRRSGLSATAELFVYSCQCVIPVACSHDHFEHRIEGILLLRGTMHSVAYAVVQCLFVYSSRSCIVSNWLNVSLNFITFCLPHHFSFYRASAHWRAISILQFCLCVRPSIRVSVRLSMTFRYQLKTA